MCEATSSTNRQHKDRLFKKVFGTKEDLLSLYNAINNTDYSDPNDVEINTVEDFIYMSMKNDVSFLIYDVLNLYEHQSSQNPNMAFRGFLYLAELYKGMFSGRQDLYSSVRLALPTPQFIVFYNGTADETDESFIKMSDAYVGNISGSPLWNVQLDFLNINYGHNKELMDKCKRLHDYSALIKKIRDNQKAGMNNVEAIDKAVDDCIKENLLADILSKHRLEVTQVLLTEYDEELHINNEKDISYNKGLEQGFEQGIEQGIEKGIEKGIEQGRNEQLLESIKNLMTNLGLSAEDAMKSLGIEQANFDKYLKMM